MGTPGEAHCRFTCYAARVRFLGVILFLLGGAGVGFTTYASYLHSRPRDVVFGTLAPVAALVMLTGLLVAFVPGFFG